MAEKPSAASLSAEVKADLDAGRTREAVRKVREFAQAEPGDYFAQALLAQTLRRARLLPAALAAFSQAQKLHPLTLESRHQLAITQLRMDRLQEAAGSFDAVRRASAYYLGEATEMGNYVRFLLSGETVARVVVEGETLQFRVYPGTANQGEALYHSNGRLREAEELAYLRREVPAGAVIVDVGANIGAHLVYFAKLMRAAKLIPVEPVPEAVRQLRENVRLNGIDCVDESWLGCGVGETRCRMRVVESAQLVETRLEADPAGAIEVRPLDELVAEPVGLLKIDVEGMELEVLRGARRLLAERKPKLMIEIERRNRAAFETLLAECGYRVERTFDYATYLNCYAVPAK